MGCYKITLQRSEYDFKWEQDKSTSFSHDTTYR